MRKNILYAVIFFAFLIGLAGVILLCAYEVDWHITVIFAGGIIFLTGLIGAFIIKLNLRTASILILCLVGAVIAGIPAWLLYAEKHPDKVPQLTDAKIMNITTGGIMALAGICVVVFPVLWDLHQKRLCTETVTAKCVDVKAREAGARGRSRGVVYYHVWEFYFDGNTYVSEEKGYSNTRLEIGEIQDIFFSPQDPSEIYRKMSGSVVGAIIMGSVFIVIGLLLCFL